LIMNGSTSLPLIRLFIFQPYQREKIARRTSSQTKRRPTGFS